MARQADGLGAEHRHGRTAAPSFLPAGRVLLGRRTRDRERPAPGLIAGR
jgi:hypothetical protein